VAKETDFGKLWGASFKHCGKTKLRSSSDRKTGKATGTELEREPGIRKASERGKFWFKFFWMALKCREEGGGGNTSLVGRTLKNRGG